jgi:hypothetical protein
VQMPWEISPHLVFRGGSGADTPSRPALISCTICCTKPNLPCPTMPTGADYRTPNLLTLRKPMVESPAVTAEVAGSSPVVPATDFFYVADIREGD